MRPWSADVFRESRRTKKGVWLVGVHAEIGSNTRRLRAKVHTYFDGKDESQCDGSEVCSCERKPGSREKMLRVLYWAHQDCPGGQE